MIENHLNLNYHLPMMRSFFKRAYQKSIGQIAPSQQAWRGAAFGLIAATLLLCLASAINLWQNDVSLGDASIYFIGGSIFIGIIGGALVLFWLAFTSIPRLYKWALACFAFVVYYFFIPSQTVSGIALIAAWTILSFSLFGGALWDLATRIGQQKSRAGLWKPIAVLLFGAACIGLLGYWLFGKTSTFHAPSMPVNNVSLPQIFLPDPSDEGTWNVAFLTYGSGKDLHRTEYGKEATIITQPLDGSVFVKGWHGLHGLLRTRYWGFDHTQLPLNGRVWYPQGEGPFPLVLIVHGNHEMSASSDKGYEYLGKHFASHGYITALIDENFLNGSWIDLMGGLNEVPARGWLILEHLFLWRRWNGEEGTPFYAKVDMDKIALIGHSRGGEAIATAAAFNLIRNYPDDGNMRFNYGFNIRGLAAIAPVDGQHHPGGINIELENVDYFVIHGSQDGDVRSFEGEGQYRRIRFTDDDYHFKAALYIYGANHGQFNSVWGKKDNSPPSTAFFDLGQIMPQEQQQDIAKVYLTAFLDASLKGEKGYLPLFRNYRYGEKWLPKTFYLNEFVDSTYRYVEDKKKDMDIAKTSLPGGAVRGENLDAWRQGEVMMKEGIPLGIATLIGWDFSGNNNENPSYMIELPKQGIKLDDDDILVMSLANAHDQDDIEEAEKRESVQEDGAIDLTIELSDEKGEKASMPLSSFSYLYPTIDVRVMKAVFLDPLSSTEYVFETFEFPLKDFMKANPAFDPSSLNNIRLLFDQSKEGLIILESVAFRKRLDAP